MEIGYQTGERVGLSAARRDIIDINERIQASGDILYRLDESLSPIPDRMGDVEYNMNSYGGQLETLEQRNHAHSAKLKSLKQELDYVKIENDMLLGHIKRRDTELHEDRPRDQDRDYVHQNLGPSTEGQRGQSYGGFDDSVKAGAQQRVDMERAGSQSGQNPLTKGAHFQENIPLNDNNRPAYNNQTVNNYDTAYRRGESRSSDISSVDEMYRKEEMERLRRREIYGCHDSTAINPQLWEPLPNKRDRLPVDHKQYPHPGGFMFMRFEDSGFQIAKDAIKRMQSICRYAGGYLLGAARKQRIFVYEVAPSRQMNWTESKTQPYKDFLMTENAVAVFWFTKKEAASDFLNNTHNNQFREPNFPTPSGYEAFYAPLLVTPPVRPYNCFLFIEFINARQYSSGDMNSFEGEVRHDMMERFPGSLPMIISSLEGKDVIKPGSFGSQYSKLFVCRFQKQSDVDDLWRLGMIQGLRHKWHLTGPINVFSFVIDS